MKSKDLGIQDARLKQTPQSPFGWPYPPPARRRHCRVSVSERKVGWLIFDEFSRLSSVVWVAAKRVCGAVRLVEDAVLIA